MSLRLPAISRKAAKQSGRSKNSDDHATSDDPYTAAQLADIGETQRAYQSADAWRRVASGQMIAIAGLILLCVVLATRYQHDVLVYRETTHGLSYESEALQTRTPSQAAVEAQLGAFIKAIRNVPGIDYALVDQNVKLALQMTADVAPAHAHQDMITYFTDQANNPKLLGKNGMLRTVLDPVIASPVSAQTWTISWAEELKNSGQNPTRTFHQGTVVIGEPSIPTDPDVAAINPAGVEILQYDLHI